MASGGNEAPHAPLPDSAANGHHLYPLPPQPDAPPPDSAANGHHLYPAPPHPDAPPPDSAANDHHLYPAHYLTHFPQIVYPNPIPQFFSTCVNTTPFLPPVNPYSAPYGYQMVQIPVPPTYQDPNLVYGGMVANPTTSQTADVGVSLAGVEKRTNGSKKAQTKLKPVQSWFCEVCKVDCNRRSMLEQHKTGKKHCKNLEKLVAANRTALLPASAIPGSQPVGPQENPVKGKIKEDLGAKTNKLLKGGTAADSMRACTICNVVCNSESVFMTHLAGQKHAKELKKHSSA